MEQKKCSDCKQIKSFNEFSNNKTRSDGKCYKCRVCNSKKSKKYNENNKDKTKEYRDSRKDIKKEYDKQYREKNKDKISKQRKEYRENNKEIITIQKKHDYQTNYKTYCLYRWKKYGIKSNDYEELYQMFIDATYCYLCNREFDNSTKLRKCLDHDHLSGYPRFVCCSSCNGKLQTVDNNRMKLIIQMRIYFDRKYYY